MKWKEEGIVSRKQLVGYLNSLAGQLLARNLTVDEQQVVVPDTELRYTLKYKEEGPVGTLSLKVEWGEEPEAEEAEEEGPEQEGDEN